MDSVPEEAPDPEAHPREVLGVRPTSLCVFIDLEKAYDRVPRKSLWEVLQTYGIGDSLLRAIGSLYGVRRSRVRIKDVTSEPFYVSVRLRQG